MKDRFCPACTSFLPHSHEDVKKPPVRAPSPKKQMFREVREIKTAVKQLQQESTDQLALEMESQATFEYLNGKVKALRNAFNTLSDAVLAEMDSMKVDNARKWQNMDRVLERQDETLLLLQNEFANLRHEIKDSYKVRERQLAEENQALRVALTNNADRMQKIERELLDVKQDMILWKDHPAQLSAHQQQLLEETVRKVRTQDQALELYKVDIEGHNQQLLREFQKINDVLSSQQTNQNSLRLAVDTNVRELNNDRRNWEEKFNRLEAVLSRCDSVHGDLSHAINEQEARTKQRFDEISRVFKVFASKLGSSGVGLGV
eukprot:GILK01002176.1.p1 GENE.GILK01002176.1~~GILK01002176.1.p1  ORF type:complete len:342 (+),score=77.17 GILK01002176.1:74-1027(+)